MKTPKDSSRQSVGGCKNEPNLVRSNVQNEPNSATAGRRPGDEMRKTNPILRFRIGDCRASLAMTCCGLKADLPRDAPLPPASLRRAGCTNKRNCPRTVSGGDAQPPIRSRAGSTKSRLCETKPNLGRVGHLSHGGRRRGATWPQSETCKTNPIPGPARWNAASGTRANVQNEANSSIADCRNGAGQPASAFGGVVRLRTVLNKPNSGRCRPGRGSRGVARGVNRAKQSQTWAGWGTWRMARQGGANGAKQTQFGVPSHEEGCCREQTKPNFGDPGYLENGVEGLVQTKNKPNSAGRRCGLPPRACAGRLYKQTQFGPGPCEGQVLYGQGVMVDYTRRGLRQNKAKLRWSLKSEVGSLKCETKPVWPVGPDLGGRNVRNKPNFREPAGAGVGCINKPNSCPSADPRSVFPGAWDEREHRDKMRHKW